jgi:hypothetical protein
MIVTDEMKDRETTDLKQIVKEKGLENIITQIVYEEDPIFCAIRRIRKKGYDLSDNQNGSPTTITTSSKNRTLYVIREEDNQVIGSIAANNYSGSGYFNFSIYGRSNMPELVEIGIITFLEKRKSDSTDTRVESNISIRLEKESSYGAERKYVPEGKSKAAKRQELKTKADAEKAMDEMSFEGLIIRRVARYSEDCAFEIAAELRAKGYFLSSDEKGTRTEVNDHLWRESRVYIIREDDNQVIGSIASDYAPIHISTFGKENIAELIEAAAIIDNKRNKRKTVKVTLGQEKSYDSAANDAKVYRVVEEQ